jgi:chromosome segregation ATPase
MTEQDFQKQVWRTYDQITTAEGVRGKVLNVCFTTKSVRAYISGSPEWIRCELIETHTTAKGTNADEQTTIEMLQDKLNRAEQRIKSLELARDNLQEKISKNYIRDLLGAVNMMQQGLAEKKHKIEMIETGLHSVTEIVQKITDVPE